MLAPTTGIGVRGVVRAARGAPSGNPSTIAAGGSGVGGGLSTKSSDLAGFASPKDSSTAWFTRACMPKTLAGEP
jgi:hypothetical protein